jgi:diadenosine tetraphosphate (Ap4A) HIT family hydrolase
MYGKKIMCFIIAISFMAINLNAVTPCVSCELQQGRIETIGGIIASTPYFEARQDYAVPIAGFVIVSSKRHVQSIDEFTQQERHDFIDFVCKLRTLMREKINIQTVYLIQEEDASHFHIWLFPRYQWMNQFDGKIKSIKPIMNWAKEHLNTPENIDLVKNTVEALRL